MWRNTQDKYGTVSKVFHWLIALVVPGLAALGTWMVGLDYYHAWYRSAPDLHRSLGVLTMLAMGLRALWLLLAGKPRALESHRRWEHLLAALSHWMLYLLVFAMGVTGYLLSTADGRGVDVFNWFAIPSSGEWMQNQEDIAGLVHKWLAWVLLAVISLHVIAVCKHQWIDKDKTLRRMI